MSDKINDGGTAFPMLFNIAHNSDWQADVGMSLRDYFAAHSPITIQDAWAIWADEVEFPIKETLKKQSERDGFYAWLSRLQYEHADAMLKARGGQS